MRLHPWASRRPGPVRQLARAGRRGHAAAVLVGLALLWALAAAGLQASWNGLQEGVLQQAELFARVLAEQAGKSLRTVELTAQTAAERSATRADPEERQALLQELAASQPALQGLVLVDRDARVVAHSMPSGSGSTALGQRGERLPDATARLLHPQDDASAWQLASGRSLAEARPLEPGVAPSRLLGLRVWPVTHGPSPEPGLRLIAVLNLEHFATQQAVLLGDEGWRSALIDARGRLLAGTGLADAGWGLPVGPHPAVQALHTDGAAPPPPQALSGAGLGGETVIGAHRTLPRQALAVVVETPRAGVRMRWLQTALLVLGTAVLGSVLLLAHARALLRRDALRLRAERHARRAARRAERSERDLRALVDGLPEWAFRLDADRRVDFVNRCWERLSGLPNDKILGRRLEDVLHPDDGRALQAEIERLRQAPDTEARRLRVRLLHASDGWRELDLTLSAPNEEGRAAGFAVDVTERERSRRELVEQYRTTEQLLDAIPQPLFLTDDRGELRLANRTWVEWLGLGDAAADGSGTAEDLSRVHGLIALGADDIAAGDTRSWPVTLPMPGGGLRETLLTKVPLMREDGQVQGIIGTLVDVTQFRQAERLTERARRAAEAAARARSEFVANVSHELRTPLQSILGFAEIGRERAPDRERAALLFQRIQASGQRMLRLVEDLLDVSALGGGLGRIELRPASPAAVLQDVCEELRSLAEGSGLSLQLSFPPELITRTAPLDAARYAQVLRNVLANAIRFAPRDSSIAVTLGDADGQALVAIRDHGPGIPEDELEAIFEPFVQSTRTRDGSGGTGLGLAICRVIMRAHQGFVIADNHPRGGAVFRIGLAWSVDGRQAPSPPPDGGEGAGVAAEAADA